MVEECRLLLDKNKFFEETKNYKLFVSVSAFPQSAKESV